MMHNHLLIKEEILQRHLNSLLRKYLLVSELWTKYHEETTLHLDYSRSQIAAELSKHFKLDVSIVEGEMTRQYL